MGKLLELPDFITIPRPIMEDENLTQLDWAVYGLVYWHSKLKLQKCILSNTAFADVLRVDARSIRRSLTRLSDGKYIYLVYADKDKNVRNEIVPLVTYKTEAEGRTVQSSPLGPFGPQNKIIRKEREYKEKEKTNTYKTVVETWNSRSSFFRPRLLTDKIRRAIGGRLREGYTAEEIKRAIGNYHEIVASEKYFFTHKWTLVEFLQRGMEKFVDIEIAKQNYALDKRTFSEPLGDNAKIAKKMGML